MPNVLFLSIFAEIIQFNLYIFYTVAVFDLIRQLVEKHYSNWLVDLVFDIFLDSLRKNIEKMYTIIRKSIISKVCTRSPLIFF